MAPLPATDRHEVFLVEVHGDTLVVTPRGDAAGFPVNTVNGEQAAVAELARHPAIKHVIVDLGRANYFGSVILGGIVQLAQIVHARQGRSALCHASSDMQDVLRLMKLDQMWEFFPNLRSALRAVAKIPLRERLWGMRKVAACLVVLAAVVLAIVFFPRPDYAKRYYVEYAKLWREATAKRELAGDDEWDRYLKRTEDKLAPMLKHLLRRSDASVGSQAELFLIFIARDHWRSALERNNPQHDFHAYMVQFYLRSTEAVLEKRMPPVLDKNHPPAP
jgi:anti-anti-sigma factor